MKLIDKDAVAAKIEEWRNKIVKGIFSIPLTGRNKADATFEYEILGRVRDFIDSLNTKEVDLEKEIELVKGDYEQVDVAWNNDFEFIARHFFELGIKAKKEE